MTLESGILLFIVGMVLTLTGAFATFIARYYKNAFGVGFGYMVQALGIFMVSAVMFSAGYYIGEHQPAPDLFGRYFGGVFLALLGVLTVRQAFISLRVPPNRQLDDHSDVG